MKIFNITHFGSGLRKYMSSKGLPTFIVSAKTKSATQVTKAKFTI